VSSKLQTVLALIAGLVVGGAVNMCIILLGPMVIAPPPGADLTTVEGLEAAMPLMQPKHFLAPFLAHALGTLVGAAVGAGIATAYRPLVASVIGLFFLAGGIAAATMIPAPTWFIALDLVAAYLPMAALGLVLARRWRPDAAAGA
jgi:hypothetical protein